MLWKPLVALVPLQRPLAVHRVALVVDQLNVEALPLAMAIGLTPKVRVGNGDGVTVTVAVWAMVPPGPVQVNV